MATRPNWSKQHQGHHQALWIESLHRDWPLTRPRSVGEEGTRSAWVQPSGYGGAEAGFEHRVHTLPIYAMTL